MTAAPQLDTNRSAILLQNLQNLQNPPRLTRFKVTVEHGLAAHVVFVGDFLGRAVLVLQVGAVDGSDQRFAQVELVDLQENQSDVSLTGSDPNPPVLTQLNTLK